jgi:hypothetical protein
MCHGSRGRSPHLFYGEFLVKTGTKSAFLGATRAHFRVHLHMESEKQAEKKIAGAGGTPGGIGIFLVGFAMACAGGWLITNQVVVTSGYFASGFMVPVINFHMNSFGLSLVPFIIGIAFLFFDGKSPVGWLLTIAGLVIIMAGILFSLHIYFQPTSLFNTLMMLVLLFGGLGLVFRSLKAIPAVPGADQTQ